MAQAPDSSSSQNSLLANPSSPLAAGTLVHIETSQGDDVLTFEPTKTFQSIAFSSAALESGGSYTLSVGGTQVASFMVSSVVTQLGSQRMR